MYKELWLGLLGIAMVLTFSACSARTWGALEQTRVNGAHFATWRHMGYSLFRGTPATTTKEDIEASVGDRCLPNQTCGWWGEQVPVRPLP